MFKSYELHESAYRNIRRRGARSWNEGTGSGASEIDSEVTSLLEWVLGSPWAPKAGKAVELGCGTGPMLRWLHARGFHGIGLDFSATAIAMAREQSQGLALRFRKADLCVPMTAGLGSCDLAIDGHCLHCIVNKEDRQAFLTNAFNLLKPGGVFVVQTMCAPVDCSQMKGLFAGQRILNGILHIPAPDDCDCEGLRKIGPANWLPTRRIAPWKSILAELTAAGFTLRHFRLTLPQSASPASTLDTVVQKSDKQ